MPPRNSSRAPVVVLFRDDLRIADNAALAAAADTGKPLICLLVRDNVSPGARVPGGARDWWLHHSLTALSGGLESLGTVLLLRRGETSAVVDEIVAASGADTVLWNRRYDPPAVAVDSRMKASLRERGIGAASFDGQLLHEPSLLKTGTGGPYKVYTPFWRALSSQVEPRDPVDAPRRLNGFDGKLDAEKLDEWKLLPTRPDWAGGLRERWEPGEAGARSRLTAFLERRLQGYGDGRDFPDKDTASGLSPHLAHGEITPFQILAALRSGKVRASPVDIEKFRKEIVWREFCHHLLFHNPDLASRNFNADFDAFPWAGTKGLTAWRRGQTGYPIVDAGMRELWHTGVMHNRVRMIAASFLIKHLLVDWRHGEKWFWDTLVDADPASNPANWQWVAGSGADAAPYFRIFNPILQGEKFDADGAYVRRWVPEIAKLPGKFIHRPWEAPKSALDAAGVKLGETYPVPLIDHEQARRRALSAFGTIKGTS